MAAYQRALGPLNFLSTFTYFALLMISSVSAEVWEIDSTADWKESMQSGNKIVIEDGKVVPGVGVSTYSSRIKKFYTRKQASKIEFTQSPEWLNWEPVDKIRPVNMDDAPVFLSLGPNNYWVFGRYGKNEHQQSPFISQSTKLEGFSIPLQTSPFPNQFDAPGGLKEKLGGYHAWQSRDLVNWVHHGSVTEDFSCWVTTAEFVDGNLYLYYDYPNDQDPHLYIDSDLTDGVPGKNMGIAFRDPSDGSDCGVIRDRDGNFHLIYEDWSPINARKHSWDSPLAGHAVSADGKGHFQILLPAIDLCTVPQEKYEKYKHPHWFQHPDWDISYAIFEIHQPVQDAYGDWAAISIGGRYYLFGDFHPAGKKGRESMSVAWFTSDDINNPFKFCGNIGTGHPDPDIAFAEGKFYLITQTEVDYVSTGPWVESVEVRVGSDTNGDGTLDSWTDWSVVQEKYDYLQGFAKQVKCIPAGLNLNDLPAGFGFGFEIRLKDTTKNPSMPILDSIKLSYEKVEQ